MMRTKSIKGSTGTGSNDVKTVRHKMENCNHFLKRT